MPAHAFMGAFAPKNLLRAWNWVRTNPDGQYTGYVRQDIENFALAEKDRLGDLRDHLIRGSFRPSTATRIFLQKGLGPVTRPYSLLTVEDQIAYQAIANVIAENLPLAIKARYRVEVFSHVYAGKTSKAFYIPYYKTYDMMVRRARRCFNDGLRFTTTFDLTACYDSIDHGVLRHRLRGFGIDFDLIDSLMEWLRCWAIAGEFPAGHGIPQGPVSSGLVSEVVLSALEEIERPSGRFCRLRYVDDCRLLSDSSGTLDNYLKALDRRSKELALFPNSSKTSPVHEISNFESEFDWDSMPPVGPRRPSHNQALLRSKIMLATSREGTIKKRTTFKRSLVFAEPSSKLNGRLLKVIARHPEAAVSICLHWRRYKRIPDGLRKRLIEKLERSAVRDSLSSEIFRTLSLRPSRHDSKRLTAFSRATLGRGEKTSPDLIAAASTWLEKRGALNPREVRRGLQSQPWWINTQVLFALTSDGYSKRTLVDLLTLGMRHENNDVAVAAAVAAAREKIELPRGLKVQPAAARVLRKLGVRGVARPGRECGVSAALRLLFGSAVLSGIQWPKLLGRGYSQAERILTEAIRRVDSDLTACIQLLDCFVDLLLVAVYERHPGLGKYQQGKIGTVLESVRLKTKLPQFHRFVCNVHRRRGESWYSHPIVRSTKARTGPIRPETFLDLRSGLIPALKEIETIL